MGIKNAGPFFQQVMVTEVLPGLVHNDCEVYLDDALIFAETEKQFIAALERVLSRFQARGIVLNPLKCSFGMSEVEILGHTINATGCHFSRQKLDTMLEIKLPTTGAQLHSFVALCNYYRQHVERIADLERPLRKILAAYPGTKKNPLEQTSRRRNCILPPAHCSRQMSTPILLR